MTDLKPGSPDESNFTCKVIAHWRKLQQRGATLLYMQSCPTPACPPPARPPLAEQVWPNRKLSAFSPSWSQTVTALKNSCKTQTARSWALPASLESLNQLLRNQQYPKVATIPPLLSPQPTDTSSVWWAHLTRRVKDPSSKPSCRSVTQVAIQQLIFPTWAQTRAQAGHSSGGGSEWSSKQRQKRRLKAALVYTTIYSSILSEVMEIMLWLCHLQCDQPLLPLLQNRFTSNSLAAMRIFWNSSMPVVLGWSERGFSLGYSPVWRKKENSFSRRGS